MGRRLILAGCALLFLGPLPALAEEVLEAWPDGTPRERYEVDAGGRRHGAYTAWFEDGQVCIEATYREDKLHGTERIYRENGKLERTTVYAHGIRHGQVKTYDEAGVLRREERYRKDVLHGAYKTWHANGRTAVRAAYRDGRLHGKHVTHDPLGQPVVKCAYADGKLHGAYEVFEGKRRISKQVWAQGVIVAVDGVAPFPRSSDAIDEVLGRLLGGPEGIPAEPLAADRTRALRVLQAYRSLVGVPYEGMSLEPRFNQLAQAAAEICDALGHLTHTPRNPGWPAERYAEAAAGAIACNLGHGSAEGSVHGYMDDSDPSNIDGLGHRSWCVFPGLRKTGFGRGKRMTAMHCLDKSGAWPKGMQFVHYPPAGYVPRSWFGSRRVWSLWFLPGGFRPPHPKTTKVEIVPVDPHFIPMGAPLPLDHLRASREIYGVRWRLAFRPAQLDTGASKRYRITVTGLKQGGRDKTYMYYVEFYDSPHRPRVPR